MKSFLIDSSFIPQTPVCVDLDGTLIEKSSLRFLWKEASLSLNLLYPLRWSLIKEKLTCQSHIHVQSFPYYAPLLVLLNQWKKHHVPLFLVTGANEKMAHAVAQHIPLFHDVWASTATIHLVGQRKAQHLRERFSPYEFTYIGDSWRDVPVWRWSRDIMTIRRVSFLLLTYLRARKQGFQNIFCL